MAVCSCGLRLQRAQRAQLGERGVADARVLRDPKLRQRAALRARVRQARQVGVTHGSVMEREPREPRKRAHLYGFGLYIVMACIYRP